MSAAASIKTTLVGVDATAAAFASVERRASGAMGKLKGEFHSAAMGASLIGLAIAGVMKSVQNIKDAANLADLAQFASTGTAELQKLAGAMDQVGVKNVNLESLANAFAKMSKNTGAVGMAGFTDTLQQISKINDEGKRMEELTRVFGREMGASFSPLVRNGPEALKSSLQSVMDMMPGLSDASAQAADSTMDSFSRAGSRIKTISQEAFGGAAHRLEKAFGENIEVSVGKAVESIIWLGKIQNNVFATAAKNVWDFNKAIIQDNSLENFKATGFKFGEITKEYKDAVSNIVKGVDAKDKLASGAVAVEADIASKASKAVDSMRNAFATFADASSYANVQAAFGSGGMNYRAPQVEYVRPPEMDHSIGAGVREAILDQTQITEKFAEEAKRTREILENLGVM